MNTFIVAALIAAILALWLVYRFVLTPRKSCAKVGDYVLSMQGDQVRIKNSYGAPFVAPPHELLMTKIIGKHDIDLKIEQTTQKMTTEKLVEEAPDLRFVNGTPYTAYTPRRAPSITMAGSISAVANAERWLRHHGVLEKPDISEHVRYFNERTKTAREALRKKFGYKEGDLDTIGVSIDLEPLSYTKLTPDREALCYMAKPNIIFKCPMGDMKVSGGKFRDAGDVVFFFIPDAPQDYCQAPISQAMQDRFEAHLASQGKSIRWFER